MSIVNPDGARAFVESLAIDDEAALKRARCLHALKLSEEGWSRAGLSAFFNVSAATVARWIARGRSIRDLGGLR